MNWIETLGPSRPPLIASRRIASTITPAELHAIFENLQIDEANAGYKINMDLQTLCKCLYAAAKMEGEEASECQVSEEFHEFYSELYSFVEVYLTEFPCLKRAPGETEVILYCLGTLVDLSKFVLLTIEDGTPAKRIRDAVFIVRTLCRALARDLPFHQQHEYSPLPTGLLEGPRRYVSYLQIDYGKDICGSPAKRRRGTTSVDRNSCRCTECGTSEPHLWIKCLVEHFGRRSPGYDIDTRGFDILKSLLTILHQLPIELTEVVLHLFAKTTETLRDDLRSNLIIPFVEFSQRLVERCEQELDRTSIEMYIVIVKHLSSLLKFLLPADIAESLVTDIHNLIQRTLLDVMADGSKSGITPSADQDGSVLGKKSLRTYLPPVSSLHSVVSRGVAWIKSALHVGTGGQQQSRSDND